MDICLIFDSEQKAKDALAQIDKNKGYPIKGRLAGNGEEQETGLTTTWSTISKIHNQEKWFIFKPTEEFMLNVTEHAEEPFSSDWRPPEDDII